MFILICSASIYIVIYMKKLNSGLNDINAKVQEMGNDITDSLKMLKQVVLGDITEGELSNCQFYHFLQGLKARYPFEPGQRELVHMDGTHNIKFKANDALFFRVLCNLLKNS